MVLCGAISKVWKASWRSGITEDNMGFEDLNSGEGLAVRLKSSYYVNGPALHATEILLQSDGIFTAHLD